MNPSMKRHVNEILSEKQIQDSVAKAQVETDSSRAESHAAENPDSQPRISETRSRSQGTFSFLRVQSESLSKSGIPDFDSAPDDSFADAPLTLPEQIGYYKLGERLGEGGMGTVYQASHLLLKREAAIKFIRRSRISPDALERFAKETEIAGQLADPHLVATYDAGEINGIPFLVMERLEGQTLEQYIKENGPVSPQKAIDLIIQAAQGLACAHRAGLIHRDVKPGNIWITSSGVVKILDLGLSQTRETGTENQDQDQNLNQDKDRRPKRLAGTPDYIAPEQTHPLGTVTERADVYSLGCVLFFLLTGTPPFDDANHKTVKQKLAAQMFEPLPQLTNAIPQKNSKYALKNIQIVLNKMTQKEPNRRYQSMGELILAFQQVNELLEKQSLGYNKLFIYAVLPAILLFSLLASGIFFFYSSNENKKRMDNRLVSIPISPSQEQKNSSSVSESAPKPIEEEVAITREDKPAENKSNTTDFSSISITSPDQIKIQKYSQQDYEAARERANRLAHQTIPQTFIPDLENPSSKESESDEESLSVKTKQIIDNIPINKNGTNNNHSSNGILESILDINDVLEDSDVANINITQPFTPGIKAGDLCTQKVKGIEFNFRWCPPGTFTMGATPPEISDQMPYEDLLKIADSYQMIVSPGDTVNSLMDSYREASQERKKEKEEWLRDTLQKWSEIFKDAPPHQVTLTSGFWMLETEVTTEMWIAIIGSFPEFEDRITWTSSAYWTGNQWSPLKSKWPVAGVKWKDCQKFCRILSRHVNAQVELPTEAQWEYACLAGTPDKLAKGLKYMSIETPNLPWNVKEGPMKLLDYYDNISGRAQDKYSWDSNDWGIYGMMGNVGEWTSDWYFDDLGSQPVIDPQGNSTGTDKICRGSKFPPFKVSNVLTPFEAYHPILISPYLPFVRFKNNPNDLSPFIGFRICVNVPVVKNGKPDAKQPDANSPVSP